MAAPVLPPGIETLPPWLQVFVTVVGFCVAVYVTFRSVMKPAEGTGKSKDVVVPSVSVLDGQVFKDATEQLRQNYRQQEARDAQVRELQRELGHQTDIMRECHHTLRSMCDVLEQIERRLARELKRQAEERDQA